MTNHRQKQSKFHINPFELVDADSEFIIDEQQGTVRRRDDRSFTAEITQTSVGTLRDANGRCIGLDILHFCILEDGTEFCIDASFVREHNVH